MSDRKRERERVLEDFIDECWWFIHYSPSIFTVHCYYLYKIGISHRSVILSFWWKCLWQGLEGNIIFVTVSLSCWSNIIHMCLQHTQHIFIMIINKLVVLYVTHRMNNLDDTSRCFISYLYEQLEKYILKQWFVWVSAARR